MYLHNTEWGQTIFEVAIKSNSISDLFFKKYSVSYDLLKAVFENQNRDTNAAITLSFYQKKKNHKLRRLSCIFLYTYSKFTRIYFCQIFDYKFGKGSINWNRGSCYKNMSHQSRRHFWQSVWNLALFGNFLVFLWDDNGL